MVNNKEEIYKILQEKNNLPLYEDLQRELDFDELDSNFVLREIREKIKDRFESFSKLLESIFQPEGDFSSYIETTKFTKEIRDDYFTTYKKLRYFIREAQILSIHNEENKDIEFIKKSYSLWIEEKQTILDFLERLKSCWIDEETEDSIKYFG